MRVFSPFLTITVAMILCTGSAGAETKEEYCARNPDFAYCQPDADKGTCEKYPDIAYCKKPTDNGVTQDSEAPLSGESDDPFEGDDIILVAPPDDSDELQMDESFERVDDLSLEGPEEDKDAERKKACDKLDRLKSERKELEDEYELTEGSYAFRKRVIGAPDSGKISELNDKKQSLFEERDEIIRQIEKIKENNGIISREVLQRLALTQEQLKEVASELYSATDKREWLESVDRESRDELSKIVERQLQLDQEIRKVWRRCSVVGE